MHRRWAAVLAALLIMLLAGCATTSQGLRGGGRSGIVEDARDQIGTRYRYGGKSPDEGFDCSGLAGWCYARQGKKLPRKAADLFHAGRPVKKADLEPGDLVFFRFSGKGADHVGIFVGGGRFVHAPSTGGKVREDRLKDAYWKKHYLGGRSLLP